MHRRSYRRGPRKVKRLPGTQSARSETKKLGLCSTQDLPRRYLIIAFWACMLAGKRPCLLTVPRTWEKSRRQKWIQQSWEQLRFPPLISDSSLHPLSEACCSHILSTPPVIARHFSRAWKALRGRHFQSFGRSRRLLCSLARGLHLQLFR